jgi:NAD(P)-dependent dehydrogenase (short-subunit alcohol dehydrogenase family)
MSDAEGFSVSSATEGLSRSMTNIQRLFSIEGKTALVTGGSAGVGQMIARAYVDAGVKVYIASRKLDACEAAARELGRADQCIALQADLSKEEDCRRLAAEIAEREPRLDILVNNAGATWGASYDEFPAKAWDRVLDLNVKGLFFLTQALTPVLSAAGQPDAPARVINIGSVEGVLVPFLELYSYTASKAAVHQLTRVLAKYLAPRHITVNALILGPFESRMMKDTMPEYIDQIEARSPLRRIGKPDDVGAAAIYLAGPGAAWLTGVLLPVDGGTSTTVS